MKKSQFIAQTSSIDGLSAAPCPINLGAVYEVMQMALITYVSIQCMDIDGPWEVPGTK